MSKNKKKRKSQTKTQQRTQGTTNRNVSSNKGIGASWKKWMPAAAVVAVLVIIVVLAKFLGGGKAASQQSQETAAPVETYDPLECVELGQYTGIEVSLAVTEEDIEFEVESLLEENAIYEELSGTVEDGDMVYADFEGYVDGVKIDTTCGSDYIEIGSGEWLDGFESSLIGAVTETTRIFTIPVPEGTYGDDTIDGHDVEFHVYVDYICGEQILMEYNDDFVQSISKKYKTTEEYNEHIRKQLEKENKEQKEEFVWSDVMDNCQVTTYPESLIESCNQEVLQGYYDMAEIYGCTREEIFPAFGYESEQDFIENDLPALAEDTAKEYLIAQAIAAKEGIKYSEEEYEERREEEYGYQEDQYDSIEEFEAAKKDYLENQTLMQTVKNWLADHAVFTT